MSENNVLEIKELSIAFGGLKAVDNLSFTIKEGETFGLIGPNGAGKTTVFNCITQFYKADSGQVIYHGRDKKVINLMDLPVSEIIGKGVVRTFQNVELIKELTVLDNVLIGAHHNFESSLLSQTFNLKKERREEQKYRLKAEKALAFMGVLEYKDSLAGAQPYGVQKKVEIARTLMCDPHLIILDEPAAGLNDSETIELAQQIKKIKEVYHCSVLLIEHDMGLVMEVCDSICAISFGKKLAIGKPKEIQQNPEVQKAYLGEEGQLD
ncbi:ABC transporter ATP-binding protein [Vagococcus salmoninarum]|uniref:ABC transporter ATP-binding protein n=1 Tax=Vagococcus salmoninarum TaxID=2739 RepID=A0A429ZVT5_9ENTE|nr:ABC transporter ATP-binding protein [Vagococcus salmoninarum]RST97838.1 ABC transporter ATP-binding protein [Vagococcus salmoninarum]